MVCFAIWEKDNEGCLGMADGIDLTELIARYSNPDADDPYMFNGVSYAPERYDRVFNTSDDVIGHIAQAKITRRMSDEDIIAKTGLSTKSLARLCKQGEGSLRDFLSVTEALGIRAVVIPTSIIFGE